ncbi:unnamed protein product, partial [Phaeothamnion confervicola]
LDIAIDGADEVDPDYALVKGGGGALLREKLVASSARRFVVMIDESKRVANLGTTRGVPIEVVPFGWCRTLRDLEALGFHKLEQRMAAGRPFLSDHGNYIFDCWTAPIQDPGALHARVKSLVGVVETGIFVGMTGVLVTGHEDGSADLLEL